MDSLYWINLNLKHNYKYTNKLFYGEYQYCASGELNYAKLLRGFDRETLEYRLKSYQSMNRSNFGYFIYSYDQRRRQITDETQKHLFNFLDIIENVKTNFKLVLGWHDFYFYTNDDNAIRNVLFADGVYAKPVVEVVVTHPIKTIIRKRSDYRYRCYLSNTIISQYQRDQLLKFFKNHNESTKLSKTFQAWLDKDYKYCRDYFFFDYNDSGLPLLLEMMAPRLIKETLEIIVQD